VWPGRRQPCTILNISGCGAKVSLDAFPDDVGQVRLVIDGLREISSDVVWRRDGEAGLRFHEVQQWVACLKAAADAPVEMRRVSADGKSGS
jgi:hypothetical protein